jgi:hypothetical protein
MLRSRAFSAGWSGVRLFIRRFNLSVSDAREQQEFAQCDGIKRNRDKSEQIRDERSAGSRFSSVQRRLLEDHLRDGDRFIASRAKLAVYRVATGTTPDGTFEFDDP